MCELRRMNDEVSENYKDGDSSLKESDLFKKQYAALLVQLNEVDEQACLFPWTTVQFFKSYCQCANCLAPTMRQVLEFIPSVCRFLLL